MLKIVASGIVFLTMTTALVAQEAATEAPGPIEPETLTVEKTIKPGANIFVLDQSWSGSSKINVLAAHDLSMKGNIGAGLVAEMALSADGKTLYTASAYARRITKGETEAVLAEYDVETLTEKREIIISNRFAQVASQPSLLTLVDDEKYILVQNATPATSVSVVDLTKGEQIAEIPTPGCWGILPAKSGSSFMSLCGDGSMKAYSFTADGTYSEPVTGAAIFDPDQDALFTNPARTTDGFLFISYNGNIHNVALKDGVPTLIDKFSITEGTEGWAPGGTSTVIGYSEPANVAFVLMHSDAEDGSHKNPAEEIWAVDMATKQVLYRSKADEENAIIVEQSMPPVLYVSGDEKSELNRYSVDPEAKFAAKPEAKAEDIGGFPTMLLLGQ